MVAPVTRKIRSTAPRVAPMVRSIAMSRPLSFTSMVMPEMMFSAATRMIRVRMRNITVRSTFSASKKERLRWRQSVMIMGRPTALSSFKRMASMSSGSCTKASMTLASSSRLK